MHKKYDKEQEAWIISKHWPVTPDVYAFENNNNTEKKS